jgi:hypothetical protein
MGSLPVEFTGFIDLTGFRLDLAFHKIVNRLTPHALL